MVKRTELDEWAAKFLDEDLAGLADAVSSEWYTTSPGSAFVVLNKAAADGKKVKVEIEDGKVEVYCGDAEEEGDIENLAEIMVTACYRGCGG